MKMMSLLIVGGLLGLTGSGVAEQPVVLSLDPGKILAEALTLIGPAAGAPATELRLKAGDRVSFMGDSITQQGGYVRLAAYVVQTKCPELKVPPFVNAGIGGQKAENMEPRFTHDMKLAEKPAWTFISVGINDVWHRLNAPPDSAVLAAFETNVTKMVEQAQAAGANVVLLAPTVITEQPEAEGNQRLKAYVAAMKSIGAAKGCTVVDLHALFLAAIARKPAAMNLTCDGVHMAAYGDAIMAIGVLRALGLSDATIATVDTLPVVQVNAVYRPLSKTAELLEIPPARFGKPALARCLGF